MALILKFFRVTIFYALYFLMCMVVVVTVLKGWPVRGQMLFAFGLPIVLVWWQEKRRARKVAAKALSTGHSNPTVSQLEPTAQPSAYEKRVERERERTRKANSLEAPSTMQADVPR